MERTGVRAGPLGPVCPGVASGTARWTDVVVVALCVPALNRLVRAQAINYPPRGVFLVGGDANTGRLDCYAPRVLLRRLASGSSDLVEVQEGSMVLADVSGFTRLSERLARTGREGAEHLADAINGCFTALLAEVYAHGGGLLKFGGDAMLLWFDGEDHAARACGAAMGMQRALRRVGRIRCGSSTVVLRMSVGVQSGRFEMFLVGASHREYVLAGPQAGVVVALEAAASPGQVLVGAATAAQIEPSCLGEPAGPGSVLAGVPSGVPPVPHEPPARPADRLIAGCLSTALREHVLAAPPAPEHRTATVAFLEFGGVEDVVASEGAQPAARALDELVGVVQAAVDHYRVCFLGSDVSAAGGKLILTAGVPSAVGDDEERMLLALRQIVESETRLPVRAGVNRGQQFAGEIGPPYRRTYTVMGDAVNLAARLMTAAPWGAIYATDCVLERSQTRFARTPTAPLTVKGKSEPVQAWEVGAARGAEARGREREGLDLVGRDHELAVLREAVEGARDGRGAMVEIAGEAGSGKSRLLAEARGLGPDLRLVSATCSAFTQSVPYLTMRDLLRPLLGLGWDDPDDVVVETLRAHLTGFQPDLLPWLSLLAIVFGAEAPASDEVRGLSSDFRAARIQEVALEFMRSQAAVPTLVAIEHAHLMDAASAALLAALPADLTSSSWVVLLTRRDSGEGLHDVGPPALSMELTPLSRADALALAEATPEAVTLPPHVLALAVDRAGATPSSCWTCWPQPTTTPTTCPRASRRPRARASTCSRRGTAPWCGARRSSGRAFTSIAWATCSSPERPARTTPPGGGSKASSPAAGTGR